MPEPDASCVNGGETSSRIGGLEPGIRASSSAMLKWNVGLVVPSAALLAGLAYVQLFTSSVENPFNCSG